MKKILIHTIANSRKNEVIVLSDEVIKVKVNATPLDGRADEETMKIIAKHFKIHKSQIAIVKELGPDKKIIEIN